jgi:NAD(P)-dependent dehydrogenase (short-subunit alcohol dehydrogenase family)
MGIIMNNKETNKLAVITGAGGVLCSTFAKSLAGDGFKVALLDLNLQMAQKVAYEITGNGGTAKAYQANVLDKDSLEAAHLAILSDLGKCSVLINGAGGNNPKGTTSNEYFNKEDINNKDTMSFFDLDAKGIEFVFNLNFLGTLLPTQVFAKDMIDNGNGNIINMSSMNAFKPLTKIPAYSGAKAAVSNFTQWLAVHFAGANIRVNALAPGFFVTNQNKALLYDEKGNATDRTRKIMAHTPMKRFGEPEELLGTLKWLIDDNASSFVTGVIIPIDGGFSAYSGV